MAGRNHLYIPGPTNVPYEILNAMHVPMEDHRSPIFPNLLKPLLNDLKKIFKTETGQAFVFPATGTAGWEIALTNTLNPGDKVLIYRFGQFGHLWAEMAKRLGFDVEIHQEAWGRGIPLDKLEQRLKDDAAHQIKAVLATHNETATGVTSDIGVWTIVVRGEGDKLPGAYLKIADTSEEVLAYLRERGFTDAEILQSAIDTATFYKRDTNGTELRAFAGNFLYSTGANEVAGRLTRGHFDFPLRGCTVMRKGRRDCASASVTAKETATAANNVDAIRRMSISSRCGNNNAGFRS